MKNNYSFENLIVWQKAHSFVLLVYKLTRKFPPEEKFVLTSQYRPASVSIAANIAVGYRRTGKKDKLRFYNFSQASLDECNYYLILSQDLEYCKNNSIEREMAIEVGKLLTAYCNKIFKDL